MANLDGLAVVDKPVGLTSHDVVARLGRQLGERRIGDERLELLAVTAVAVEPDMRHATVLYDSLHGADDDDTVQEALREHRVRLQRAIGRQARIKRTPELVFRPDEAVRTAARLDEILRHLEERGGEG